MDAGIPEGAGPFPAVVLVHGGGWVSGDRHAMMEPLFQPLSGAGIAWFTISYRFATGPSDFGAAIDDVEAAVRFVISHAREYRIDPHRIALVGESAGGHLAAMAALRGRLNGSVRAVVALYSPSDLVSLARSYPNLPQSIRHAVDGSPWLTFVVARLRSLSPLEHVTNSSPPFLLIHGTADPLVPFDQSVRMCDKLKRAGAECELYPVQGAGHGIRWWGASSDGYKRHMVEWLERHLEEPAGHTVQARGEGSSHRGSSN